MNEFLDRVAEALEVPSVSLDFVLSDAPYWSSLAAFTLMVMIQQEYGRTVPLAKFREFSTVADLAAAAGVAP